MRVLRCRLRYGGVFICNRSWKDTIGNDVDKKLIRLYTMTKNAGEVLQGIAIPSSEERLGDSHEITMFQHVSRKLCCETLSIFSMCLDNLCDTQNS